MKVLVTGAEGQLGFDVIRSLSDRGHEVLGCNRNRMDITDLERCKIVISSFMPECIIHCAAYTAVDAAETDHDGAYQVNVNGTRNVAIAGETVGAKLVYISTDYVFDGLSHQPYREYDTPNPLNIYGKSKYAGELLVQSLCSRWFIVRTSWVFGPNGRNFVKTMLEMGQRKGILQVVNDQHGSPTYTHDLAAFLCDELILTEKYGIYHVTNQGECSWYEFAEAIFEDAAQILKTPIKAQLEPCTTKQFPRPAPRPQRSVMDQISVRTNGFQIMRPWRDALRDFLSEGPNEGR